MLRDLALSINTDQSLIKRSHDRVRHSGSRTETSGIVVESRESAVQSVDRFPNLDLLRAFAAISVVVYHVIELIAWKEFSHIIPSHNGFASVGSEWTCFS
jgi:hypothetical protein